MNKKKPVAKTPPRYHTEILWSRIGSETTPVGFGVRDTQSGEIVVVHPMDTPLVREMLPDAKFFRAKPNHEKVEALVSLDEFGRAGKKVSAGKFTKRLLETPPKQVLFEDFKNNPELSLVPLRYKQNFGKRVTVAQGYALVDEKTGAILRHVPEKDMLRIFSKMGCTKVRVGKYGAVTSLDLEDGSRISEKQFLDGLLQVERAERPRKSSKKAMVAGVVLAGSLVVTGVAAHERQAQMEKISGEFNTAAAPHYSAKVIRRAPGTDPMASYHAIKSKDLRRMLDNWFIDGTYQVMANRVAELASEKLDLTDETKIAENDAEMERLERKMLWPVEAARAVDTMWNQDERAMRSITKEIVKEKERREGIKIGKEKPSHLLKAALDITYIESVFGEVQSSTESSAEGYHHFLKGTFLDTVRNYEKRYGHLKNRPRNHENILALRHDSYTSTLMFLEYARQNHRPGVHIYVGHFAGAAGAAALVSNPNANAADANPENAKANASLYRGSNKETVSLLKKRYNSADRAVESLGFKEPIIVKGLSLPEFGPAFKQAANMNASMNGGGNEIRMIAGAMQPVSQYTNRPVAASFH